MYMLDDIKKIIKKDQEDKCNKYYARNYYNYKPSMLFPDTSLEYDVDIVDSNNQVKTITKDRLPVINTNYSKLLINQKVDYMLSNEPTIESIPKQHSIVDISDMLEDMCLTASLDITAWLFIYIKDNALDWTIIPDSQIKPIYDQFGKNIIEVIRYYDIKDITHVEIWSFEGVQLIQYKNNNKSLQLISDEFKSHYNNEKWYNGELVIKEAKNLPFIPFIPMHNNKNMENDIECIKDQLDFYNIIKSGFVANIFKFQEFLMKLQGFSGDEKFYKDTMDKMQKYKMICLPDNETDAGYMAIEIPTEAREIILMHLRENIFKIGQAFDPDKIGDGNITNIVIKNRYSGLNMKSDKTIKQTKLFYQKFIECLNLYYGANYSTDITFNKSINWNESELIDNCVKSVDIIPDEIIIENHPWVTDKIAAIELMKKEKLEKIAEFNNNMSNNFDNNIE